MIEWYQAIFKNDRNTFEMRNDAFKQICNGTGLFTSALGYLQLRSHWNIVKNKALGSYQSV